MGTDIHFYIEKRKDSDPKGPWEKLEVPQEILPYDRNYELFAMLAAVRNGGKYSSFEKISPQLTPGQIPSDTSLKNLEDIGDHSYTYGTLIELQSLNWELEFNMHLYVNREEYQFFKENGYAKTGCGGVDYKVAPTLKDFEENEEYQYVYVGWKEKPLKNCYFRTFVDQVLPRFCGSCGCLQGHNVRILMGFDS